MPTTRTRVPWSPPSSSPSRRHPRLFGSVDIGRCDDSDADTIRDTDDDCPFVAYPAQTNGDGDALGDVCDPCPSDPDNGPVRFIDTNGMVLDNFTMTKGP